MIESHVQHRSPNKNLTIPKQIYYFEKCKIFVFFVKISQLTTTNYFTMAYCKSRTRDPKWDPRWDSKNCKCGTLGGTLKAVRVGP